MSRYDGMPKLWTRNCEDCPYRQEVDDGPDLCLWGVAWKRLFYAEDKLRACQLRDKPSPREAERVLEGMGIPWESQQMRLMR